MQRRTPWLPGSALTAALVLAGGLATSGAAATAPEVGPAPAGAPAPAPSPSPPPSLAPSSSASPARAAAPALPLPAAPGERSLAQWYALGGWVMHLIALCSVLAGAIALERAWALRSGAVVPRPLLEELRRAWGADRLDRVQALCDGSSSSLARLVRVGLRALARGAAHPLEHVASAGEAEALRLRRNLPLLAALANLATMLGLLGTVLGMIEAFDVIAAVGTGDARVVARGIFQALVTTAAGLGVGIGALAAHAALRRRAERGLLALESALNDFFDRPAAGAVAGPWDEPGRQTPAAGALTAPAPGVR